MAVRTAYAGTAAAGDVYTAANHAKMPGGWIGYAEVTANQTGISSETDLTSLTLTVTVGASRRIRVSFQGMFSHTAANAESTVAIKESSTYLQLVRISGIGAGEEISSSGSVTLTPTTGSHTYKLSYRLETGTGTVELLAGATFPASITVEDLGPSA